MRLGTSHGSGRPKITGYIHLSGPNLSDDCGLPANIVEMFKDPVVQEVAVVRAGTANGQDFEGFAVYGRFEDDPAYRKPQYVEKDLLTEEMVKAWSTSAGFDKIKKIYRLVNGYDPEREDAWWLVKTQCGFIEIGWRKRVINIDWSDTPLRLVITTDDVTKEDAMVHAWSVPKVIEYLTEIRKQLLRQ